MIVIDLSKQQAFDADSKAKQQINFIEHLNRGEDVNDNSAIFFIIEEARKKHFRLLTRICESIVNFLYCNIISV